TPDVPGDGDTRGLDLPVGHVVALDRLDAVLAEGQRRAALGHAASLRVVLLAVLDPLGHQHGASALLPCTRVRSLRGLGGGLLGAAALAPGRPAPLGTAALLLDPCLRRGGLALGARTGHLALVDPNLDPD